MKSRSLLLLASAGMAIAHPSADVHNHKRHHGLKAREIVQNTVNVYELNGQQISYEELQEGIQNGTLVLSGHAPAPKPKHDDLTTYVAAAPVVTSSTVKSVKPSSSPSPSPAAQPETTSSAAPQPETTSSAAPVQAAAVAKVVSSSPSTSTKSSSSSSSYGSGSGGSGLNRDYDNSLSCDQFPSAFGAVAINYLGLGGWTGIQTPGSGSGSSGLNNIVTSVGGGCTEGAYCSYACPAGYEKTQWPSTQGATGQSVGGLLCQNGKLTLTQSGSPKLCSYGTANVKVNVQNKMSASVAVCRTDYPGTESMTIPIGLSGGATSDLTCPDAANTYTWQGGKTSAQYYVNPAGSTPEDSCIWGKAGKPYGNFAPLNLGVGYSNGKAWLSIFQNSPTTNAKLDFKVSLVGSGMNGECVYQNGAYTGGGNGCTVAVANGGSATFVFESA